MPWDGDITERKYANDTKVSSGNNNGFISTGSDNLVKMAKQIEKTLPRCALCCGTIARYIQKRVPGLGLAERKL